MDLRSEDRATALEVGKGETGCEERAGPKTCRFLGRLEPET